jgi:tetrahydromethanopterin S-methyltransferase subunit G
MDLRQGLHPIVGYNVVAQRRAGKLLGLLFGCLVVGIMIFMMFAILGGLFVGEQ